jgi:purine-binding chemotaxis protein CheW
MKKIDISQSVAAGSRRFLTFRVGKRIYALPAEWVTEVIRIPMVARVPQAPKALLGVANLRGAVLPLVSLRLLLGMDESAASRAIVCDDGAPVAIAVDAVDALITVESSRVETKLAELSLELGERLKGVFSLGEGRGAAKILDVQSLLSLAFAQRGRPLRQSVAGNAITTRRNLEPAVERDTFITFDVAGQEFALDLGAVQEIISLPDRTAALPGCEALGKRHDVLSRAIAAVAFSARTARIRARVRFGRAGENRRYIRRRRAGRSGCRSPARRRLR